MHPLLWWARAHQPEIVEVIRKLVECESPSGDVTALGRFGDLIADTVSGAATCRKSGQNLLCAFQLPGPKKKVFEPEADFKKYGEAMLPTGLPWLLRFKRLLMFAENVNE